MSAGKTVEQWLVEIEKFFRGNPVFFVFSFGHSFLLSYLYNIMHSFFCQILKKVPVISGAFV
jgi:hypothetical protein